MEAELCDQREAKNTDHVSELSVIIINYLVDEEDKKILTIVVDLHRENEYMINVCFVEVKKKPSRKQTIECCSKNHW